MLVSSVDTNDSAISARHPVRHARSPDSADAADRSACTAGRSPSGSSRSPQDVLQVNQGSLYPALHRLEHRGWIDAEWGISELGRRAKYYRLTASGRRQLAIEASEWERMSAAIGRVMKLA